MQSRFPLVFSVIAVLACFAGTTQARAATLYDGWSYAIDAMDDGSGGSAYELRGLAFRTEGDRAYVAISGGLPLGGPVSQSALNGRASHGDLILNFSGHDLSTQAEFTDARVFGIRFDALNDSFSGLSGVKVDSSLGVYENITVASKTQANGGYATLTAYKNAGFGRTQDAMGDLDSTTGDVMPYFGSGTQYPNMATGAKIGDITLLNESALTTLGLDFGHFGADPTGNHVFGFSFDAGLLPVGDFTASLFAECINDGVVIHAANVPEPGVGALMGASALLGGGSLLLRRRRKNR